MLQYGRQWIDEEDIAAVAAVLRTDFLTTGPAVDAFEAAFVRRTGAGHAVACANGTAALHLAALALELGPGDFVVVPTITFLATANAARYVGAEVIFADVDPDTGLMRPEDFDRALAAHPGARVKAVFPVHLAGHVAHPAAIAAIAAHRGIAIVEDACHALGTTYAAGGEKATVGDCRHASMQTFSFHPVKTATTGEGGMVTTRDGRLAERLRLMRNHGMARDPETGPWAYAMAEPGFNYRLSDIQCALGTSQLAKLDRFAARRREIAARYDRALAPLSPRLRPVRAPPGTDPVLHLYQVLIDFAALGTDRATVMGALAARGIGSQVHYIPVHTQPYYRSRYGAIDLPGARRFYERTLSLPLHPSMTDGDADRVVEAVTALASCA